MGTHLFQRKRAVTKDHQTDDHGRDHDQDRTVTIGIIGKEVDTKAKVIEIEEEVTLAIQVDIIIIINIY